MTLSITIDMPDLDFTPIGKRSARYVQSRSGLSLRWYVGGRIYRKSAPAHLTSEWLEGAGRPNHCPQPWAAFE
jgi:hypothetical protein